MLRMEIQLTRGKVAVIDDADAPLILAHSWSAHKRQSHHAEKWYAAATIAQTFVLMHTFLTGYPMTDHRDGDGLNNRRQNLRRCTQGQNSQNSCKRQGKVTSQYKGV